MVQEATPCLQVVGGAKDISLNEIRQVFEQIEADLYRSDVYRRVQSNLQNLPQEIAQQMQRMVRAIGREAIRLAFRKLVRQRMAEAIALQIPQSRLPAPPVMPPPPPPPNPSPVPPEPTCTTSDPNPSPPKGAVSAIPSHEASSASQNVPTSGVPTAAKPNLFRRRLNKTQRAALARQTWEEHLRQVGQEIREARQAKSISLFQMHCRTNIPIHQLEALERGDIERLPEDIYIRGFLRQIGNALGWNGTELAESLPIPFLDPVKAVLPTWYRTHDKETWVFHPMYLYVGYAMLMAGGLTWISQQAQWERPNNSLSSPEPSATVSSQADQASQAAKNSRAITKATLVQGSIAPPERNP